MARLPALLLLAALASPLCAEDYGLEVIGLEPLYAGGMQPTFGSNHSLSFSRLRGFRRADNPDAEFNFSHRWIAGVNYGVPRDIPGDLTLSFFAPFVYRDFRVRTGYGVVGGQVAGIGDLGLFARARYLWFVPGDGSERSISLSASAGVELPTGASGLERDGIRLPRELQPGRGAASLTLAHIATFGIGKLWFGGRLDLSSVTLVRHNSVGVGGGNYDFGDVFRQEVVMRLRVIQEKPYPGNTMFVGFNLGFNARSSDRDHGRKAPDTGLREITLRPWVSWHSRPWDVFHVEAQIALWRQANGTQLVEGVGFFVSYGRRF